MTATSIIGQALPRLDSAEKVRGQTRYTADIHLPGMLYARFVTSYQAHARITDIDTSAARAVEGGRLRACQSCAASPAWRRGVARRGRRNR